MVTTKTLNRSELYQLVWREPMARLAKSFGLSDVGLAKICRKYDIPRPPRGYWAKKQHGYQPRQIPLPKREKDDEIEMRDSTPATASQPNLCDETTQLVAVEQQKEMRIDVAETLHGAHELVRQANQDLQAARTDEQGIIVRPEKLVLDISTTKHTLRRALLIMAALLKALEKRGYSVEAGPVVTIMGTGVRFGISEQLDTKREPADDDDLDGPYTFRFNRFKDKRTPSGRLTLKINSGGYWLNGCRHTWRDTDKRKLENRLNQFVAGLVETAARIKQHEEEERKREELRRQAELRRQEEARQLAEKRKQFKLEKARVDALLQQAKDWRLSHDVRALVEAVREAHSASGPISPDTEIAQWIDWATRQADRLDPLRPGPPSILDENIPEEETPQQRYYGRW
jgi:hypothetical protein